MEADEQTGKNHLMFWVKMFHNSAEFTKASGKAATTMFINQLHFLMSWDRCFFEDKTTQPR